MSMRILFADAFDADRVDALRAEGHDCVLEPDLGADDLAGAVSGANVLVVRSTKGRSDAIAAARDLSLIIRAGAGVDNIDVQAAADAGIYVSNVPGQNSIAVAELAMGLLLAIDRQIVDATTDLRAGRWDKARYREADGLYGKTVAVVGLGAIGLKFAERAKAFGLTVRALRKDGRRAEIEQRIRAIGIRLVDSDEDLLHDADIVSIHVPGTADTEGLVDATFLAQLPDGAIVLNTSRGNVVDEAALLDALDNRGFWAGLDVFANEPGGARGEFESALAAHPRVVGNHHVGASTRQAQGAVADGTVAVIEAFAAGRVDNCVNMEPAARGVGTLVVRHLDKVGVLAQVLQLLRGAGINVKTMQNQIFAGSKAAVATISVDGDITPALLDGLSNIDEVIGVSMRIDST
ncbi:MAG: hydroxyacid dehydrogenase [Acidimicrobiales bacterium]|nr:hydroxyacid dehydrogenase [Acidimicrobiales bacterium]